MKNYRQIYLAFPFILFLLIIVILWRGLNLHPNQIPSPFIDKNTPTIDLPTLFNPSRHLTNKDFLGQVTLFNVWATWCSACADEHALLLTLAKKEHIIFVGLNYKDDTTLAKKWLHEAGNPYQWIAVDETGQTAIDWGVYGTPETFIIDKKGVIRYKQIGPITEETWQQTVKPLLQQLKAEPT